MEDRHRVDSFDELDEVVDVPVTTTPSQLQPSSPQDQVTSPVITLPAPSSPPSSPLPSSSSSPLPSASPSPSSPPRASLPPPTFHARLSLSPRAGELPLSPSFLQSLATLPALSPTPLSSSPSSDALSPPPSSSSDSLSSPFIPCPCQAEPPLPSLLTTPRKPSPSSPSPSPSSLLNPAIPSSISHILFSISATLTSPPTPSSPPSPPTFSPSSIRRIVDYLEFLSHHLSHTHTTLIRYLQHSRHQQLLPPTDPLLLLLERSNLHLVNQLKQLKLEEDAGRQRMREVVEVIEGGKKTAALSLARLPAFMQTEKRRGEEVERAKAAREEEVRGLEGLAVKRGRVQQQLMAVSGVVGELKREGGGRLKYDVALDGMRDAAMREVIGEAEASEAVQRLEVMKGWREQEEGAELKLKQIERVEKEMRERLDQLIIMYHR